jgi:hypothetical protein
MLASRHDWGDADVILKQIITCLMIAFLFFMQNEIETKSIITVHSPPHLFFLKRKGKKKRLPSNYENDYIKKRRGGMYCNN